MESTSKFAVLSGVILAMLLSSLDQTIVATAMPEVVRELNGLSHLSWVFTAYMLASTVTVPIYGKLSDIFGRRGFYLMGIAVFLLGSILSGMSGSMLQLILFRGLQGIGGGAMMVNSIAVIDDVFPPAERGRWQGVIGGVFGLSSVAGPLLGGWITDNFSWRWVFYVNIPVGIIAIIVLASALPRIKHRQQTAPIDYFGAMLIAASLIPLLLALVWGGSEYAWSSATIISLFAGAALALVAFLVVESRIQEPILSLRLFRNKVFSVSVITTFLTAMGMFGAILYIPIFAHGVVGVSATHAGLILTPMMISLVIASAVSGQLISKTGKYKILAIVGMAFAVVAMYMFSLIGIGTTNGALSLRMIFLGIGLGMTMPIFTIAVQSAFPKERLGEVTAGTQLFRSIGGTVGTAVLGGIMNSQLAQRLSGIGNEPFVAMMRKMNPNAASGSFSSSSIQALLTPQGQEQVKRILSRAPAPFRESLTQSYYHFLRVIQEAFSFSVDRLFLVGCFLMVAAFLAVLFLPEIPLRAREHKGMEEVGMELEYELAQVDAANQPE